MGTEAVRFVAAAQALAEQPGMPLTASERARIEAAAAAIGDGGSGRRACRAMGPPISVRYCGSRANADPFEWNDGP